MGVLSGRAKRAFENFKAYAHSTRRYPPGRQLAAYAYPEWLLYAVNPVYAEVSQGGASPMRGSGAIIFLMLLLTCIIGGGFLIYMEAHDWGRGIDFNAGMSMFGVILGLLLIFGSIIPALWLYLNFLTPTDAVLRFDRKRQVAWMWTGKGAIEIPWSHLTPAVQGMAVSPLIPARTYRGLYVGFGPGDELRFTDGIPHVMQIGPVTGGEEGALFSLEWVRRYMEEGPQSVPRPHRLLRHRPEWRAMFNFVGLITDWDAVFRGESKERPWLVTAMFVGLFPWFMFLFQVTNWLALRVAPLPKWPRDLEARHAADLAEVGPQSDGISQPRQPRKAVVRVNGQLVESDPNRADQQSPIAGATSANRAAPWRERIAAMLSIGLAVVSTTLVWFPMLTMMAGLEYGGWLGALSNWMKDRFLTLAFLYAILLGAISTAIAIVSLRRR